MSTKSIIVSTLATASLASAGLLPNRQGSPRIGSSSTFRLAAKVTGNDLTPSLQNSEVHYNSTAFCRANLVFGAPGSGSVFYTTNSTTGVAHFPESTETVPAGLVVTPGGTATVPGSNVVQAECEAPATQGVTVAPDAALGQAWYLQFDSGAWMACSAGTLKLDVADPSTVVLSYKEAGQRTIAGCADVELLPVCDHVQAPVAGSNAVQCLDPSS